MTFASWIRGLTSGAERNHRSSRAAASRGRRSTRCPALEILEDRTVPATVDFAAAQTFATGIGEPVAVVSGDFNNDGAPDLAIANQNTLFERAGAVDVLLGDGLGDFAPAGAVETGGVPMALALGDFDNDGNADLAVANYGDNSTVSVLRGDGLGGFLLIANFGSGGFLPRALAVTDFNNDGNDDLAVVNQFNLAQPNFGPAVSLMLGDGTGAFGPPVSFSTRTVAFSTSIQHYSDSVAVGDFNGDNNADFAVTNIDPDEQFPSTVGVLLGDGTGGFAPAVTFETGGTQPVFVAVGDFNNDGAPDLALANQIGDIGVLLGNGLGGFAPAVTFASGGSSPRSIALGDFNNDGQADLAVAHQAGNVGVLLGNGLGGFAAPVTFDTGGAWPLSLVAADFNNDGRTDLAVTNYQSGTVGVLLNTTNQPPVNTVPDDQVVAEDVATVIGGLSVADDDAAGVLTITLTVGHGTLTINGAVAGGLTATGISGNGTATLTLTGTQAQINATLAAAAGLQYKGAPNYSGLDTLTMTTTDAGGLSDADAVAIEVSAQQQAEALTTFITDLGDAGVLKPGREASLLRKLDLLMTLTKPIKLAKKLDAFVHQVTRLVKRGILTLEQGKFLIEGAQSIVASRQ